VCGDVKADQTECPSGTYRALRFPFNSDRAIRSAKVLAWCPVLPEPRIAYVEDIAVLELVDNPAPDDSVPQKLVLISNWAERRFEAFGFTEKSPEGDWVNGDLKGEQTRGWVQLLTRDKSDLQIDAGFSGGGVWDSDLRGFVGILVANKKRGESNKPVSFMIPAKQLQEAWRDLPAVGRGRGLLDSAYQVLTDIMSRQISLGALLGAGLACVCVLVLAYMMARTPVPRPEQPQEEELMIDVERRFNESHDFNEVNENAAFRLISSQPQRIMPLISLCKSLRFSRGPKPYEEVVVIISKPFEKPYQRFTGSTIIPWAPEHHVSGEGKNASPTKCYACLVHEENDSTILTPLIVSPREDLSGRSDLKRITYEVPESRQNARLIVILGMTKDEANRRDVFTNDNQREKKPFRLYTRPKTSVIYYPF
jgi:hypothetical protein